MTSVRADPIPAIREEDATGHVAIIYQDLRATLGIPIVNLIWRHLATIPGGLAWVWTLVKPLYVSGELDRLSDATSALVSSPTLAPLPDFVWDGVAIDSNDRRAIARLIESYNRGNGVNFLALLVVVSVLRDGLPASRGSGCVAQVKSSHHSAAEASQRLLGLSELSPPVSALVRQLDEFGRLGSSDAIASLYRHLAHWPAFLAMAYAALEPLHRNGELANAQQRVIAFGRQESALLVSHIDSELPALAPDAAKAVLSALDEFTRLMIGRMIVMGKALRSLIPSGDDGRTHNEDRNT
jgi:hypothetical protein